MQYCIVTRKNHFSDLLTTISSSIVKQVHQLTQLPFEGLVVYIPNKLKKRGPFHLKFVLDMYKKESPWTSPWISPCLTSSPLISFWNTLEFMYAFKTLLLYMYMRGNFFVTTN